MPIPSNCNSDLGKEELIKCLENSINKYVTRKFDMGVAEDNLTKGKHRMSSKFIIDKFGKIVNIKVRSENEKVSNHLKKVINNIPDMKPANHKSENVHVNYILLLTFIVR